MRYFCLLLTIISLLGFLPAFGQKKAKVDTVEAFRMYIEGRKFEKAAKYDSAIANYQQASEGYKAYAWSLPAKKKWATVRQKAWEKHYKFIASIGWCLFRTSQLDSALKVTLAALDDCKNRLPVSNTATPAIYNTLGLIYLKQNQFALSLNSFQQSLAIKKQLYGENHPEIALSYNNIGILYYEQGQYALSLKYYLQSLAIKQQTLGQYHLDVAKTYNNIGNLYIDQGLYTSALVMLKQSLVIKRRIVSENHPDIALAYNNIGVVYELLGQYSQALEYYHQALDIRTKVQGQKHFDLAESYSNIANVYNALGQLSRALDYHRKAQTIFIQALSEQNPDVAGNFINIGKIYLNNGQSQVALEYYQKGLTIFQQMQSEPHPIVASSYNHIGNAYMEMGLYAPALENYLRSLTIRQQVLDKQHPDVANSYNLIGNVYMAMGLYAPALENHRISVLNYLPDYTHQGFKSLLVHSPNELKDALIDLSKSLMLNRAPGDDTFALATVNFADRLIDSLRRVYTYENDKLELGKSANKLYQVAIDVSQWNKLDEEAFYYSEKNKAAILAQSLNEATALKLGGIPDSLLEKDKELRTLVAFYTKASIDEELKCPQCDSTKLHNFKKGLFDHQQQHTTLKNQLESDFPQYFALKYKDSKISVKEVQQGFLSDNPNSAIIEYLLGDTVLYAFCITKDIYSIYRQKLDSTRFKKTNALRLEIKKLDRALADINLYLDPTTIVSEPASALYDYLIKPFEQQIKSKDLIIIPDGELNKIPFEILVKPKPNLNAISKWQDLPYLIKQHIISYHYSANLLLEDWQKNKSQPTKSSGFVAFAPVFQQMAQFANRDQLLADAQEAKREEKETVFSVFLSDQSTYPPLPGTEREVKSIYELFNQKNQPAKYYLNEQANESTVKSLNLKPYKYLHFATHGLTDEDRPTQSCLILAQKADSTADNLLTSSEMYGLELDADLVVLSACQTGKGTLKAGEGIIGLTRGLLYAGARNLLVSQWNVNDASTAELMTKFYSNILAGQSNRQALREAKLELLNSKFACPHFWSAFVLVGR
jgi:CHAT domain-containing protein/Tfp pilus assembly protein PilF